jgi:AraC-like DNA-binding protein
MWTPLQSGNPRPGLSRGPQAAALTGDAVATLARRNGLTGSVGERARSRSITLGDIQLSLAGEPAVRLPDSSLAAPSGAGRAALDADMLHIGFLRDGRVSVGLGGRDPELSRPEPTDGDPAWFAAGLGMAEGARALDIRIPQHRLADRGVRLRAGRLTAGDPSALGAPLRAFALAFLDSAATPTPVGSRIAEQAIEDLVVGMFLEGDGYAMNADDLRAGLRTRAVAQISARHRDPDLNPARVAERVGVSLRHLQRAFEGSGTSLAQEICRSRAESAAVLLAAPGARGLTVAEIATRSGFASSYELRAAFRDRFALLPSQYRRDAEAEAATSTPTSA